MWDLLFASQPVRRRDLDEFVSGAEQQAEQVASQQGAIARLQLRTARLELVVEALMWILESKLGVTRDEVALMVQRIDLSDGYEDGQLGPDKSEWAPKCPSCARPVNPAHHRCIYCDAVIEPVRSDGGPYRGTGPKAGPADVTPAKKVTCTVCGEVVPEEHVEETAKGPVCARCAWKVEG
jgi:hypothetical protein